MLCWNYENLPIFVAFALGRFEFKLECKFSLTAKWTVTMQLSGSWTGKKNTLHDFIKKQPKAPEKKVVKEEDKAQSLPVEPRPAKEPSVRKPLRLSLVATSAGGGMPPPPPHR